MNFEEKLANVVNRYEEVQALLSTNISSDELVKLNKELSVLEPVVGAIENYKKHTQSMQDDKAMMEDASLDKEMREMAEAEYYEIKEQLPEMEKEIRVLLLPKEADDEKNAILEVRAGTGGDEAALFAAVLFEMYQRYSQKQGWKFEILDANENGLGGYKEASAKITGKDVFAKLKFESGAHRVQRVPITESQGRVHTSAATVAVLPEIEEVDMYINPADLKIDVYRASGAGGQHVNRTESAVRITHIPTGIVVSSQTQRSQFQNRDNCWKMLRARLYEREMQKRADKAQEVRDNQGDNGWGFQIRSYVLQPYRLIKDLRTDAETADVKGVLDGDIDLFLSAALAQKIQNDNSAV